VHIVQLLHGLNSLFLQDWPQMNIMRHSFSADDTAPPLPPKMESRKAVKYLFQVRLKEERIWASHRTVRVLT